jgi:MoaA/NifB/PqqE/SkfB family radical SAM enzyme
MHIDLDFGKVCKLSCPHCFKDNKELQHTIKNELSEEDLKIAILKLKKI